MRRVVLAALILPLALSTASAHYLYVYVQDNSKAPAIVHLVFEEGPAPRDGKFLDPFIKRGKSWVQTADSNKPVPLKLKETTKPGKRWLSGPLEAKKPYSVTSYGKWGVYAYGKINVLLHYHAQYLKVGSAKEMDNLGRSEHLQIDLIPKMTAAGLQLQVLWKGKPAAGRPIYVRGPKRLNARLKTNAGGKAMLSLKAPGRYTFRTFVELNEAGTFEGKKYDKSRYHFTLVMNPPVK